MIKKLLTGSVCIFGLVATAFSAPPISTTSTISFSNNPVNVGDPVTVTASISPSVPDTGKFRIDQYFVAGVPAACGTAGGSFTTILESATVPFTTISTPGYTAAPGSYGYRAHFIPAGGSGFHESMSPCVDLIVTSPLCTGGLLISAINASGTDLASPPTFTGGFKIVVQNCTTNVAPGVTAQGGSSAWTTVTGVLPSTGSVGVRKQTGGGNQILLWTIGDMSPGATATLQVNLTGPIKATTPDGTQLTINGPWSALSGGVKTTYTGLVTITVVNPGH